MEQQLDLLDNNEEVSIHRIGFGCSIEIGIATEFLITMWFCRFQMIACLTLGVGAQLPMAVAVGQVQLTDHDVLGFSTASRVIEDRQARQPLQLRVSQIQLGVF